MKAEDYLALERRTLADPEGAEMSAWVDGLRRCETAEKFYTEAAWVICCSGISYRAARTLERAWLDRGVCSHPGKRAALEKWRDRHAEWWERYAAHTTDLGRVAYLGTLPYMGPALRYQLAKNLGCLGVCKPDRHLIRIAAEYGTTPQPMCERIAQVVGQTVARVDTIVWFAAMRRWA